MHSYGGVSRLFTITAPGQKVLPYDDQLGLNEGKRQVAARERWRWNIGFTSRFAACHRAAQEATYRQCGRRATVLAKVSAFQKRGVLHGHVALGAETLAERVAADVYMHEFSERASRYGFGGCDRGGWEIDGKRQKTLPAHRAGGYLSKYLTKDGLNGPEVLETARHAEAPARIMYVKPGLSPWTMTALRRVRFAHFLISAAFGVSCAVRPDAQNPGEVEEIIAWIQGQCADPVPDVVTRSRRWGITQ